MRKFELTLWTDEMVYVRAAVQRQFEDYGKAWRKCFIEHGPEVAEVYLPAIEALRRTMAKMDKELPPK